MLNIVSEMVPAGSSPTGRVPIGRLTLSHPLLRHGYTRRRAETGSPRGGKFFFSSSSFAIAARNRSTGRPNFIRLAGQNRQTAREQAGAAFASNDVLPRA
jgi:hypothetical protein